MNRARPDGLDARQDSEHDFSNSREKTDLAKEVALSSRYLIESERESDALRKQLNKLLTEFDIIQEDLVDAQQIIAEQQTQLGYFRQEAAMNKTNYEHLKIENMVKPPLPAEGSTEFKRVKEEMVLLRDQLKYAEKFGKHSKNEHELNRELYRRKHISNNGNESISVGKTMSGKTCHSEFRKNVASSIEPQLYQQQYSEVKLSNQSQSRSDDFGKKGFDSMENIRQLCEQKDKWKQYAYSLIDKINKIDHNLLETESEYNSGVKVKSTEGQRWYNYSRRLLAKAVYNDLERISEFDRKLLDSLKKKNCIKKTKTTGCDAVQIHTDSKSAQTRKRLSDKIREFFRK